MEQKIEREWKSIVCPDEQENTVVMCEWHVLSEQGRIVERTLKQIDCQHPKLTKLGGPYCSWACEQAISRGEKTTRGMEWLLVCCILVLGLLWILFYDIYVKPPLRFYGLLLFVGIPCFVGLMLYWTWKIIKHMAEHRRGEVLM